MPAERFDFPNAQGHQLTGLLESPDGEPAAYALFAHCFTCSKDSRAAKRIADALAGRGIAVLLESGRLAPPQPQVYPLEQAAAAVASLENRTARGKVVLRVR